MFYRHRVKSFPTSGQNLIDNKWNQFWIKIIYKQHYSNLICIYVFLYFSSGKKSVVHYCNKIIIRSEGGTKKLPPGRRSNNNGGVVPSVSLYLHKI